MQNDKEQEWKKALKGADKVRLPVAKKFTVEVWKEIVPGLYVNKVNGHKLSANDFDLYKTHLEWSGVSIVIEKF